MNPGSAPAHLNLAQIEALLATVPDPEIPVVSIRELGILREVRWLDDTSDADVEITLTPTYSGCPAVEQIEADIRAALAAQRLRARIKRQLAPAWTTDWISDATKEKLRAYGIAPPHASRAGAAAAPDPGHAVLRFAPYKKSMPVACPQCGSTDTVETSHFGSTACKALYKCLACLEPFDYFKPY